MPSFRVTVREEVTAVYFVDADSAEAAASWNGDITRRELVAADNAHVASVELDETTQPTIR